MNNQEFCSNSDFFVIGDTVIVYSLDCNYKSHFAMPDKVTLVNELKEEVENLSDKKVFYMKPDGTIEKMHQA